jgi:hypothetical protein
MLNNRSGELKEFNEELMGEYRKHLESNLVDLQNICISNYRWEEASVKAWRKAEIADAVWRKELSIYRRSRLVSTIRM